MNEQRRFGADSGSDGRSRETTLEAADALQSVDAAAALAAYLDFPVETVAGDEPRVRWILEQPGPTHSQDYVPLLDHILDGPEPFLARKARNVLATGLWYRGERRLAEGQWLQAVEEGRELRDELWIGCLSNLAMLADRNSRMFEALVLLGMAQRASLERSSHYSVAFASSRLGDLRQTLGDVRRSAQEFELAERHTALVEDPRRRAFLLSTLHVGRARLLRRQGQFAQALAYQDRYVEHNRNLPESQLPVLVGSLAEQLELRYELEPAGRGELLRELESLHTRHGLGEHWLDALDNGLLPLRLRHAIEEERDLPAALERARELLAFLERFCSDEELAFRASQLGRTFSEHLASAEDSQRAFAVAANAALRRILEMTQAARVLPELLEATRDDLEVLASYRARLLEHHASLSSAIADLWRAGHPAVQLVLDDSETVTACAWCRRIQCRDALWLPLAQFLPDSESLPVNHGICPACMEQVMQEM